MARSSLSASKRFRCAQVLFPPKFNELLHGNSFAVGATRFRARRSFCQASGGKGGLAVPPRKPRVPHWEERSGAAQPRGTECVSWVGCEPGKTAGPTRLRDCVVCTQHQHSVVEYMAPVRHGTHHQYSAVEYMAPAPRVCAAALRGGVHGACDSSVRSTSTPLRSTLHQRQKCAQHKHSVEEYLAPAPETPQEGPRVCCGLAVTPETPRVAHCEERLGAAHSRRDQEERRALRAQSAQAALKAELSDCAAISSLFTHWHRPLGA